MEAIWSIFDSFTTLMQTFKFHDLIDILVVSIIFYNLIKLLRETRAGQLVKGIIFLVVIYILSWSFQLKMLHTLLDYVFQFSVIFLMVAFQPEFRKLLEQLGHGGGRTLHITQEMKTINQECIKTVCTCAAAFQSTKTGALIVFERKTKLGDIISTGTTIDAEPSVALLENIFFNKAPLHDGAVIIRDGRICAAGCILPLTSNKNINANFGTRHRAALGMSENSDAILLVVSEETGNISTAINGELQTSYSQGSLRHQLQKYIISDDIDKNTKNIFKTSFWKNLKNKTEE
jgi:diadenylate cyclase